MQLSNKYHFLLVRELWKSIIFFHFSATIHKASLIFLMDVLIKMLFFKNMCPTNQYFDELTIKKKYVCLLSNYATAEDLLNSLKKIIFNVKIWWWGHPGWSLLTKIAIYLAFARTVIGSSGINQFLSSLW